jgi:hypothetical protein
LGRPMLYRAARGSGLGDRDMRSPVVKDATTCGAATSRQVDEAERRYGPSDSLTAVPVCHIDAPLLWGLQPVV